MPWLLNDEETVVTDEERDQMHEDLVARLAAAIERRDHRVVAEAAINCLGVGRAEALASELED